MSELGVRGESSSSRLKISCYTIGAKESARVEVILNQERADLP